MCKPSRGTEKSNVVYLKNKQLKIGILPEVGGRMVFFGELAGKNMLLSDSSLWHEGKHNRIIPEINSPFKAYNGMITWLGPQSNWWIHQNIDLIKKKDSAIWPPDPYIEYDDYRILKHSDDSLVIEGNPSPLSGVRFTKTFAIKDNSLEYKVKATNISDKTISWDLWTNARFHASTPFFIPYVDKNKMRIEDVSTDVSTGIQYEIKHNCFTTIPEPIPKGKIQLASKAFLFSDKGRIIAFPQNHMLIIEFDKVSADKIHPNQAFIEVYHAITNSDNTSLLELEHHSHYAEIMPGQSLSLKEKWSVLDISTCQDLGNNINLYQEYLDSIKPNCNNYIISKK